MWQRRREQWQELREDARDFVGDGVAARMVGWGLLVYLVVACGFGFYWSRSPDLSEVPAVAAPPAVPGVVTTATLIRVVDTLLDKSGGFLSNDILPPGGWLDNMPNWEYGALIQSRDMARALREAFSRSQSQSEEDVDLGKAEPRLNFSNNSWAIPASESQYRDAADHLRHYRQRLEGGEATFYARADNLNYWLGTVSTRLGSLSQRLSASVGQRRVDPASADKNSTDTEAVDVQTPWTKIDDVFFEARGTTWALVEFLRAVEVDFADVLKNKNAQASLRNIIRELEDTQQPIYSPMILNGDGFGMLPNHSLVMANYISRANAAIMDLRNLLAQG